jgi:TPR repeat protein
MYLRGDGVAKDEGHGLELYGRPCKAGDAAGCLKVGDLVEAGGYYHDGPNGDWFESLLKADAKRAIDAYARACELGQGHGCYSAAYSLAHAKAGARRDLNRARELLERGCLAEKVVEPEEACSGLVTAYEKGEGVAKDPARAFEITAKLCTDRSIGCSWLARKYEKGEGVRKDPVRAGEVYERLCMKDEVESCARAAALYERSDKKRAAAMYARSCKLTNDARSCASARRLSDAP